MCFTKNVSLATFLIGVIGGLLCFSTGINDYKVIGLIFIFFSLMQGIEYLLWSHQECDEYNKMISTLGMVLNHLQPIVLFILLYIYNKEQFIKFKNILIPIILIYTIVIILYSLEFKKECTMKNDSHLKWEWNFMKYKEVVYSIFLLCLILSGLAFKKYGLQFSLVSFFSFLLSNLIYDKTNVVGSMWCFFSVFGPWLFYLIK